MKDVIALDEEILLFLNNLGSESFDSFWLLLSDRFIWIPFYLFLSFILYKTFRLRDLLIIFLCLALGILISDQVTNLAKFGFQRLRPCHQESLIPRMRLVVCSGLYGFYSAHASNCFFLANFLRIIIGKRYRWIPCVLFSWAILVSCSRIYLGVHFPLDILVGMILGSTFGYLFAIPVRRLCVTKGSFQIRKNDEEKNPV